MSKNVRMIDKKCPKCGSNLNTDDKVLWCSFVGCSYGIDENVLLKPQQRETFNPVAHPKLRA